MRDKDYLEYERGLYERNKTRNEQKRDRRYRLALVLSVVAWALMLVYILASSAKTSEPAHLPETAVCTASLKDIRLEAALPAYDVEKPAQEPVLFEEPPAYTAEQLEALALVIYQEAGGDACQDSTRQMVGEVVLNRVADERFPDTIQAVLTAPRQYGRLHWMGLVWPERASAVGEAHAVERAYHCAESLLDGTVERLLPQDAIWQAEFPQGQEVIVHQDGFYFCR